MGWLGDGCHRGQVCQAWTAVGLPPRYTLKQKQESLANAKVNAPQQCVYESPIAKKSTANKRKEHNVEKYIQWVTTLSLTIRLADVACQIYKIPQNSKIQIYSNSRSSKVIDLDANRKHICYFLLVINSNFGLSITVFEILTHFARKYLVSPSHPCLTPNSGGTPCDINVIYTPLESTFSGLQFCWRHYGSIFIRVAVVASQIREITQNSDKIWPYDSSRSSKVIDLDVNKKPIMWLSISH